MMIFKIKYIFIPILYLICTFQVNVMYGQDHQEQFRQFKDLNTKDYNAFVDEADEEFAEFIRQNWKLFQLNTSDKKRDKPKPINFPKATSIHDGSHELKAEPLKVNQLKIASGVNMPVNHKTRTFYGQTASREFEFFGQEVSIAYVPELKSLNINSTTPEEISNFWKNAVSLDYTISLDQLYATSEKLQLNDYGYYLLVRNFSNQLFADHNLSTLMTWFLLNKSKFKAKIGYNDSCFYLMIPSMYKIYGKSYFAENGIDYYLLNYQGNELYSYENNYSKSYKVFDFAIKRPLSFLGEPASRKVSFEVEQVSHEFEFIYNQNAVDFYREIPQLELTSYFNSLSTGQMQESIIDQLHPVISKMDERSAVAFLLKLVQNGFNYKVDQEQFGSEKAFFPEEILFYPFSDCEDRSVFFAYLVSRLTSNEVIGLDYPEHVAIGVHFNDDIPGDYYIYKGKKYIVCDPTYVNAPIGTSMKDLTASPAEIIHSYEEATTTQTVLQSLKKLLGIDGETTSDKLVKMQSGKVVAANYTQEIYVQNNRLQHDGQGIFIASYNAEHLADWIYNFDNDNQFHLVSVEVDKSNNTYVLYRTLQEGNFQVFLLKLNSAGKKIWQSTVETVKPVFKNSNIQALLFSNNGDKLAAKTYSESKYYQDDHLKLFDDKILVILPMEINKMN